MREIEINKALAELQTKLPRINKDLTAEVETKAGRKYTYSYADLALISREVLPLLGKVGLSFTSRPTINDEGKFVLMYELRHVSGEMLEGEYPLSGGSPQEIGSAITYARRYTLCAVTGVAPDDDDHDAVVAEKAARRQRREASQPKAPATPAVPPMNAEQQKQIQNLFLKLGMVGPDSKAKRLEYAVNIVDRPLGSATELSHEEAGQVIAHAEEELAPKAAPGGEAG